MGSRATVSSGLSWPCMVILVLYLTITTNGDLAKDREQCTDQLIGLATCLQYVGGEAKAPTMDCCSGIRTVIQKSKVCLCILVKDRNDPNLGLKINSTLALGLPQLCHSPTNISECLSLLHLAPNSPDAKVFEDFATNSAKSNVTSPSSAGGKPSGGVGSTAQIKSDGGRKLKQLEVGSVFGLFFIVILNILPYC